LVTLRDVKAAVARAPTLRDRPRLQRRLPAPETPSTAVPRGSRDDPLWAEAERLGVPVMFHEGTDGQLTAAGLDRYDNFFMTHMISHPFEQCCGPFMIAGGVLERFPRLKDRLLESGCAWLPFWLHRMHEHWEKRPQEVPWLKNDPVTNLPPAVHHLLAIRTRLHPAVVDYIGEDYVCWASTIRTGTRSSRGGRELAST